jgi:GT2 family glycosyltransferase
MPAVRFSTATVLFRTPPQVLARALGSLAAALREARAAGLVSESHVLVVANDAQPIGAELREVLAQWPHEAGRLELVEGHGNLGYGRANNLALGRAASDVHLVMNPDVELDRGALVAALRALERHPGVGLVAPAVRGEDGAVQYLCKRYPSVWVLFLRGFAPAALRERFARHIADYEMRDVIGDAYLEGVPLASGCFMVARTALLAKVGGFDPRFFMYFEDYDLTLRLAREAGVAYVPEARIVHLGGAASRKGWRHVAWFVGSAWRFFSRHGWKLV